MISKGKYNNIFVYFHSPFQLHANYEAKGDLLFEILVELIYRVLSKRYRFVRAKDFLIKLKAEDGLVERLRIIVFSIYVLLPILYRKAEYG